MDATTLLVNLGAYSAQIACIAALATLLAWLLRSGGADVRYVYWRVVLGACVVLPFVQGWRDPAEIAAARAGSGSVDVATEMAVAVATGAAGGERGIDWLFLAGVIVAAGVAIRLVWLAASLLSLRRMRALGTPAQDAPLHADLQQRLGTSAEIRYVDGLRQPVTFGALRPVVLLPASLREHPEAIQQAVLCHELFHVQRRDWLWVLGEEAVRAVLWFNPAVWWLIARVQLAREELVDELTVLATNRRRAYMEALLAFADESPLAPAAAFARKRHLFRRMVLLSREGVMSSRRIAAAAVAVAAVMLTGSWYAVKAFPLTWDGAQATQILTAPGPLEKAAKPITPENPVPRRISHVEADYPAQADVVGMTGLVTFRVTLDEAGRVAEVRQQSIMFRLNDGQTRGSFHSARPQDADNFLKGFEERNPGLSVRPALNAMATAAFDAVRQWRYDPPHDGPIAFNVPVPIGEQAVSSVAARPRSSEPFPGAEGALRVGGNVMPPWKVRDIRPVYPPIALQARVSGVVIAEILVGADGTVQNARVLRSIPLLDQAALDAVMQWQFRPTLMNGVPTPVVMTVTVNFTLQ